MNGGLKLFHNEFGLIDGNSYGFLLNSEGNAVAGFPEANKSFSETVLLKDLVVEKHYGAVIEITPFKVDHTTVVSKNIFRTEDGFVLVGRRGAFTQSESSESSIVNNKFLETWGGGSYLEEIPTSPNSNGQIDISRNKFRINNVQTGSAQARMINTNGTEGLTIIGNSYKEVSQTTTAFLVFVL